MTVPDFTWTTTSGSSKLGEVGVSARGAVEQLVNGAWAYIGSVYSDSLGYYNTKAIGITSLTPLPPAPGAMPL